MSHPARRCAAKGPPHNDEFARGTRYVCENGSGVIDVLQWRLRVTLLQGEETMRQMYDFTAHPLRELALPYLLAKTTKVVAGSVGVEAQCLLRLGEFLHAAERTDMTGQGFGEMLDWLKRQHRTHRAERRRAATLRAARVIAPGDGNPDTSDQEPSLVPATLGESTRRQTAEAVIRLYTYGLTRQPPWPWWDEATREAMVWACAEHFRGEGHRSARRKRELAVTRDEFTRLLRAIRLELEACEAALASRPTRQARTLLATSGARRAIDPNPYVCFALLAALECTLRAAEFNALCWGDDTRRPGQLYVDAPNKRGRYIILTPETRRALELARQWSDPLRRFANDKSPLLLFSFGDPRAGGGVGRAARGVRRVTTLVLGPWLEYFYAKYFARTEPARRADDESLTKALGIAPVLYTDPETPGAAPRPFTLAYADARAAGLTDHSREERNAAVIQKRADHLRRSTTEQFYLEEEEQERLRTTAKFLAPHSERLRMRKQSRVIADPTPTEQAQLAARGALVPITRGGRPAIGGHCDEAATGDEAAARAAGFRPGCARSGDCRMCDRFRIYVSRRAVYVSSRDATLAQAAEQHANGNLREAENLRLSAALDQASIDHIDEYARGALT